MYKFFIFKYVYVLEKVINRGGGMRVQGSRGARFKEFWVLGWGQAALSGVEGLLAKSYGFR